MPAEEKVTRKRRAILSTDVKSYSRMMSENDVGSYQMLSEAGILSLEPGKGKNIFLGIGIALALHAGEILTAQATTTDRLLRLANSYPQL